MTTHHLSEPLHQPPDAVALSHARPDFFPAVLDSHSLHSNIGRYNILFAAPDEVLVAREVAELEQLLQRIDAPARAQVSETPFDFGWFVYLSYEAAVALNEKMQGMPLAPRQPLAIAIHCRGAVTHDRALQQTRITACDAASLAAIRAALEGCKPRKESLPQLDHFEAEDGAAFKRIVRQAKECIVNGEIYQANLSRRWHARARAPIEPAPLYRALSRANPAPFAGLLQCGDFAVVSSSPERLLQLQAGVLQTRPIAGTRPRSNDADSDAALMRELMAHPKERAEHIMLIDMARNDVGRVCRPGTVAVDELMVIESYQHVHHIVSNVRGVICDDVRLREILATMFPGGTITGCPKVRCMQVIGELEQRPRGAYTGSMGYINSQGNMDFNILIRSMTVQGRHLSFLAGAGIVYDSDPDSELLETQYKAQGLINSL